MTLDEKRTMRTSLVSYMSSHPVKSKLLSPYSLRYFAMALSALVLVLGGSVGVSFASQSALPNQTLYPVKIWIEEYKSSQAKLLRSLDLEENKFEQLSNKPVFR